MEEMKEDQKTSDSVKYGLFKYDNTRNVGDEIQSIAARRFLPRVDYYINRDNIDETKFSSKDKVKIIMNGWYTHNPENWPPKNKNIEPLLISMHIHPNIGVENVLEAFKSKDSVKFLNKFGPVGLRDKASAEFLKDNGVNSYFSGCMTLTINPDKNIKKQDYILAVSVSDKVFNTIKVRTKRSVIRIDTEIPDDASREQKFAIAEYFLYLYQSAHCIVTNRLHATLPSMALGTSVLFLNEHQRHDTNRFKGLIELTNHLSAEDFIKDASLYNINNPPKNPDDYKKIRQNLEAIAKEYTGFDSKSSFLNGKTPEELLKDVNLIQATINSFNMQSFRKYQLINRDTEISDLRKINGNLRKWIKNQESEIENARATIDDYENSKSWKLTKPLRKINQAIVKQQRDKQD